MALRRIRIYWGTGYQNTLDLNDNSSYISKTVGLFDSPDVEPILADTTYSSPVDVRGKLKERQFVINVAIKDQPYLQVGQQLRSSLIQAVMSGFPQNKVKVEVERKGVTAVGDGTGYLYVIARCTAAPEVAPGVFQLNFTASDPIFTLSGTGGSETGSTGSDPGAYPDLVVPYDGTAPTEPTVTLQAGGVGGVWRYYREVYVTNRSDYALHYHPVCISLGNISALVGDANYAPHQTTRKYFVDGDGAGNTSGYPIKDIRVESQGGARKICWVRDDNGANTHTDVRVWTLLYSLNPGETKMLRVFYGNWGCTADDETPYAPIKPMFSMYTSDNTMWAYGDFLPVWNQPQSRNYQWHPYVPDRWNLDWIKTPHPHFDVSTGNVPCAGGKVQYYNRAQGAAGVQLTVPIPVQRLNWGYRVSTNFKDPLVLRVNKPDGREEDIWQWPSGANPPDKSAYVTLVEAIPANDPSYTSHCYVSSLTRGGATFAANDTIVILRDDASWFRSTVTAVSNTPDPAHGNGYRIDFSDNWNGDGSHGVPAAYGNAVQQAYADAVDQTYALSEQPISVAFMLRSDQPDLVSGDWYYGAAEWCHVYFEPTKYLYVGNASSNNGGWAACTEVDLTVTGFQCVGRFGNPLLGEYIGISTVLPNIGDKVIVDCAGRTCYYYRTTLTHASAAASAGSYEVTLQSVTNFPVGAQMYIVLSDGSLFRTRVKSVTGSVVTMADSLPLNLAGTEAVSLWENRFEALSFDAVRQYWVHLEPGQANNALRFIAGAQSLFTHLTVTITFPVRYY